MLIKCAAYLVVRFKAIYGISENKTVSIYELILINKIRWIGI